MRQSKRSCSSSSTYSPHLHYDIGIGKGISKHVDQQTERAAKQTTNRPCCVGVFDAREIDQARPRRQHRPRAAANHLADERPGLRRIPVAFSVYVRTGNNIALLVWHLIAAFLLFSKIPISMFLFKSCKCRILKVHHQRPDRPT